MKILAIRGKNLASLEGEFEIDFTVEPLKSAGIFAITGQTGAGKSTILDALCLALFDNAPRLNKAEASVNLLDVEDKTITQKDSRNILRRGMSEGYAEVDFVALNRDEYRSRWMVRRARGKSDGALQATSIKLENLTTNREEQGTKSNLLNRIVELIGLTFDQFIRAVLLAQGDFANFLKAKSSEKAELLEKLTGTEIYSKISTAIYQKTSEAKNSLDIVHHRIGDVKLLTDEELHDLKEQRNIKNGELIPLKDEIKRTENRIVWLKEHEQIKQEISQAEQVLETCKVSIREASPRYEYMRLIDKSMEIRDSYQEYINRSKAQRDLKVELENNESIHKSISIEFEKTSKRLLEEKEKQQEIDLKFNALKPDIDLAKELDIKIRSSKETQANLAQELDAYAKQLRTAEQTIHQLKESQTKAIEDKTKIEEWFSVNEIYKTIVARLDLIENLMDTALSAQKQKDNAAIGLKSNQSMLETYLQQLENLEAEAEHLNKLLPVEILNLRHRLIEGEACPVCGSLHHPIKIEIEDDRKINEEELEKKKQEVKNSIDRLKVQIEKTHIGITEFGTYVKNFDQQYLNSYKSLKENLELYPDWESKLKNETLKKELSNLSSLWIQNKAKYEEYTILLETSLAKIDAEEKAKELIAKNLSDKQKSYEEGEESLRKMVENRKLLIGGRSVEETEKDYQDLKNTQSKLLDNLSSEKEKNDAKKTALYGKIEQQKKDEKANLIEIDRLKAHIQDWLKSDEHPMSAETLKDLILKPQTWINEEKGYLSEIQNKQLAAETTLKERKNRLLKHSGSEDKPKEGETSNNLSETLNKVSEQTESINKRLSEIEVALLAHEKGKEQIKSFEKELQEKSELYENWSKLNELLGSASGNKFKNIAQEYTLDVLLSYANKHLEELTKRYRLEKITDTLALQVVDNDMLGEVRSVHSLSGGESFLISLALALGLSSLSSNKMKIESLFIDEGFGALDIDTLSIAMDALDNLQTQGRKIGVISHVEEMKERITTQIQVLKLSNGKSSVKIVG